MCCFSRPVRSVTETTIFCRLDGQGRQLTAYAMRLNAPENLAMILPIPAEPGSGEKAIEFIDLQFYRNFFDHLNLGFPDSMPKSYAESFGAATNKRAALEVKRVGSFDASYVPSLTDFSRLDGRFRLPEGTWKSPQYLDWGFVVFKLRKGEANVHPMAFSFPTRYERMVFFPTVHIHDGQMHETAEFDHVLYCQAPNPGSGLRVSG